MCPSLPGQLLAEPDPARAKNGFVFLMVENQRGDNILQHMKIIWNSNFSVPRVYGNSATPTCPVESGFLP